MPIYIHVNYDHKYVRMQKRSILMNVFTKSDQKSLKAK